MTLEVLQKAMVDAMKNKDKARKDTISALVSAVKKSAIDKMCKDNITEQLVNEVILKEKKTVQEMIDTCPASREDLLVEYTARLTVINEFAPKIIADENEIRKIIFDMLGALDVPRDNKGAVMKAIMPQLKTMNVEMKTASKILNGIFNG